ncbi:MAG: hypothetical protein J6B07_04160 [Opitutales bacterium]|jgi:hypothetical protein|nr:hypothetical protein [Opitutales bacterium]
MFFHKKNLFLNKNARSVRPKDPLWQFKKDNRGEIGRFSVEGEIWRAVRKLIALAGILAFIYFIYECWQAWNIFQ